MRRLLILMVFLTCCGGHHHRHGVLPSPLPEPTPCVEDDPAHSLAECGTLADCREEWQERHNCHDEDDD